MNQSTNVANSGIADTVVGTAPNCLWYMVRSCYAGIASSLYNKQIVSATVPDMADDCVADTFSQGITGQFFVDGQCNPVNPIGRLCGQSSITFLNSPISLIWDSGTKIDDQISFTQFAIDPDNQGKWFTWKASEATPLLVHDPEHTGRVASARQLFGNYTFGKNWQSGYDALATLDMNGDRKLTDEELASLALWFDRNRNGVSEEGEVQGLTATGVDTIFYTPDRTDSVTGDIHAAHGYERMVEGKRISGASVDWFARAYNSRTDAVSDYQVNAAMSGASPVPRADQKEPALEPTPKDEAGESVGVSLNGAWLWGTDDESFSMNTNQDLNAQRGLLTLKESGLTVTGHSYLEVPVKGKAGESLKSILAFRLIGRKEITPDGEIRIEFEIKSPDGSQSTSQAHLSADGTRLLGITTASMSLGTRGARKSTFEYRWQAIKQ